MKWRSKRLQTSFRDQMRIFSEARAQKIRYGLKEERWVLGQIYWHKLCILHENMIINEILAYIFFSRTTLRELHDMFRKTLAGTFAGVSVQQAALVMASAAFPAVFAQSNWSRKAAAPI